MQRRVLGLVLLGSIAFQSVAAAAPSGEEPQAQRRSSSTGKRVVWTLIGAGVGFGAGLLIGLNKFDDATNSDRKVWTSALVGAGAGGVAGALLSGRGSSSSSSALSEHPIMQVRGPALSEHPIMRVEGFRARESTDSTLLARVRAYNTGAQHTSGIAAARLARGAESPTPAKSDSLGNGMIAGAVVGAVVGLIVVPNQECKPSNPECPRMLRIGVGIPAVAGGAAIGALVDKLFE